jgi:hypothetical protein
MFKKILVANRGVRAEGAGVRQYLREANVGAHQIARACVARTGRLSRGDTNV